MEPHNIEQSSSRSQSKRKRTQNTTSAQYLLYIEALENDYVLRSGTVDPTVEDNYLDKRWDDLVLKLNSIGKGPALTKQNWQKRFKDWKNATRAKYRKIVECRNKTGGGLDNVPELTPLEERGLEVWGKVTVTGTPLIKITGGIKPTVDTTTIKNSEGEQVARKSICQSIENLQDVEVCSNLSIDDMETITIIPQDIEENGLNYESTDFPLCHTNYNVVAGTPEPKVKPNLRVNKVKSNIKVKHSKTKNLNHAAEQLKQSVDENNKILSSIDRNLNQFVETYKQSVKTEEKKLYFEIQKYKFEHNDFVFD